MTYGSTTVEFSKKAIQANRLRLKRFELAYYRSQFSQVRRPDGRIPDSTGELMDCVATFYENLYASRNGTFSFHPIGDINRPITAEEIRHACTRVRNRACPAADEI